MKTNKIFFSFPVLLLACVLNVRAQITWGPAANIGVAGVNDISVLGSLNYAEDWGNAATTINGVAFTEDTSTAGDANVGISPTQNGVDHTGEGTGASGTAYYTLTSANSTYVPLIQGSVWGGTGTVTITLNNLTVGHGYQVEVWENDSRGGTYSARNATFTSAGGNSVTLACYVGGNGSTSAAGGLGQYALGTFTAGATSQSFTMTPGGTNPGSQLNAIMVRDITGYASGTWNTTTSGGNWSSTGNWTGGVIANGATFNANFNMLDITTDPTVVHLDSARTIGNLIFGDLNPATAAGWLLNNNGTAGNILTLAGTAPTIIVNPLGTGKTATISAVIAGTVGLTKLGAGTLTLGGATETFTGGLNPNAGTLTLDFSASGSPTANLIGTGNALTMGGGSLNIVGAAGSATPIQTVNGLTLAAGNNVVTVGSSNPKLVLGAFTQSLGATMEFVGPATIGSGGGNVSATGTITTTTQGSPGTFTADLGLLWVPTTRVGIATVGLYDYASTDTTGGGAGTSPYTIIGLSQVTGGYTTIASGTTTNADNVLDITGSVTLANSGYNDALRFNTAGAITATVGGSGNYAICGVLVTPNVAANNTTINFGTHWFKANGTGANPAAIDAYQNNPLGELFFSNGAIADWTHATTYVQAGAGTVVMSSSAVNLYTGANYLNGGVTEISADSGLGAVGTGAAANLNGGTLLGGANFTLDNAGNNKRPVALGGAGGGLAAVTGTTMTVDGIVSGMTGSGPLTIGIPASAANGNTAGQVPGTGSSTANAQVLATGTVALTGANTYTGGTILATGTAQINGIYNFGGANYGGLAFSGGTLQYATGANGAGSLDLSPAHGLTVAAGSGTIDLNGNAATYVNSIGNGGNGALTVLDSTGGGSLTLSGGGTYTGTTTVGNGTMPMTLKVNGTFASSSVNVSSNATFGGTGTLAGNVSWANGSAAVLTPGSPLAVSGTVNFNSTGSGNPITINANGLTSTGSPFTLLTAGSIGGTGTVNSAPGGIGTIAGGYVGVVSISGNSVILTVSASGVAATWTDANHGTDDNWSDAGNWTGGVPQNPGDSASFGSGGTGIPVNLNVPETVGGITFNSASSYTISGGNTLTLNNNGHGAAINVSAGPANAINTAVELSDVTVVVANSGDSLALGGTVSNGSGTPALTISGGGTVVLSQANTYGPLAGTLGTTLGGATIQLGSSTALGAGDVNVTDNSTLKMAAPGMNLANNIAITAAKTTTVDNGGNASTLSGAISGSGALQKINSGTLTLSGNNTYSGNTTVNAGVLSISSPNNVAGTAAIILNGGDLLGGTLAETNNIAIGLPTGSANTTALLDAASGQSFMVDGTIASAGNSGVNSLTVNSGAGNNGALILGGTNTFNGSTSISNGVLELASPLALQTSTLNYSTGTVLFGGSVTAASLGGLSGTNTSLSLTNLAGAAVALTVGGNNGNNLFAGTLSGSGSLIKTGTGMQTIGSGGGGGARYTGTTTINNGTLTLGGIGSMAATGNLDISGINGSCTMNLVDSANATLSGMIELCYDGGAGYPAVSSLTVANNANLSSASFSFGNGSRVPNLTSVTVTNNGSLSISGAFDLNDNIGNTAQLTLVNLNGGTLAVGDFIDSDAGATHQAQVNFNGGVLQANANDPSGGSFLPAFAGLTVYVNSGAGAVVKPNGYKITIAAPVVHGSGTPDGGLTLNGAGTLVLNGANTYTGDTTITNGTLALGSSGSIAASQHIIVGTGGLFDVSAKSGFTLALGQSLSNYNSTAMLNGSINTGSGTVALNFAPGTPAFMITNGSFTLNAATIFQINNTGPALALGSYKLISTNSNGSGFIAGTMPTSIFMSGNGFVTNTYPSLQITNGELYLAITTGTYTNPVVYPPAIAFPGAQGFGAATNITGGRFGTVYHVTSLADDGSPGTFRAAVGRPNRIIIFDVGGYINLGSAISASSSLTIAGQTAPGGGIGLKNNELSFYNQNNIICRHLRVRQGGSSSGSSGINIGSSGGQANNMIFDHTSVEFGQWDSFDAVHTYNFTIQYCIIADPINQRFGAHVEGANASYLNNLWVNAHNRQPLAKASTVYVNNVCYDYQAGYTTANTAGHFSHDIVNNYFITGPSTTSPNGDFFQFDGNQVVYGVGNLLDSSRDGVLNGGPSEPGGDTVSATPWSPVTATIPTVSAQNAYRIDVSSAGAFPSDPLDSQVISQVTSLGTGGRLITSPGDTGLANGGYGTINGGTPLTCTDGDGIPDIWKNAVGLNLYTNQAMVIAANGYANIENYINWLAGPHAFVQTNATTIDLWPYTLGFTNGGIYTVSGAVNGSVTVTNSHFANFVPAPGFTGLASFNFAVADPDGTTMTNTMGLLVSVVYIPQNLVWVGDGINNLWDTTNTADWFNGNDQVVFNSSDNVTFDDTGSASPAVNINSTVAPASVVFNANQNYTLGGSGGISGAGSLTKSGVGTLSVNNNNTFSGGVDLNSGTIQLNNGSSLGSGTNTLEAGTLVNNYASGNYLTLANPLLVPDGDTATINLGNSISLTGILTGNGTLNLDVQSGGATEQFKGNTSAFTGTVNLLGSGGVRLVANGGASSGFNNALMTINVPVTMGFYDNSGGNTYYFGSLAGTNASVALYVYYGGAPTVQIGALNLDSTFAGQFQTSVNLVKTGTGMLTLTGNSTHSGSTTVSNGTLQVTGSFSSSPVTVVSGATLAGNGMLGNGLTIQSGGSVSPGPGGGTLTVTNNLTLNTPTLNFDLSSSPAGGSDQIMIRNGSLTMSGVQTYNFNLLNDALGAGTYTLIGGASGSTGGSGFADNLPGNTRQSFTFQNPSAGVQLLVTGNAGSLVWQGTNGGNWDLAATVNWLNGSVADTFYNLDLVRFDDTSTNGNVSIVGVVQPAAVLVTNSQTAYTIGGGVLGGITSLMKTGPGTLILNSSNSYTGGTLVNGGTLQLAANGYAAGNGPISLNGGTVFLNGIGTGTTISCAGTNTLQTYGQPYASFSLQGSGWLNLNIGGGGVFTPGGDWSGFSGTIYFTTGNWLRDGASTFGSANAVWNFGSAGGIYNKSGAATVYFGALFGGASAVLGGGQSGAPVTTYIIGGVNANSVFNGTISDGGLGTVLIFNGPGSLTLTGNNTYSGGTTVNAGSLYVNNTVGCGTGTGSVSVNSGATLGGNGTIGGQVSLAAGATLAPGGSGPGTLTITNNLGLNDASILQFQLGTSSDQVSITGDLTLGGALNISATAGFGPGTYTLFTYGGALSLGTLTFGTTPAGFIYTLDTSVQGQVNLIVSLPEIGHLSATPNGFVMSGSGGVSNAVYYLLASTNLTQPLAGWTRVLTNQFDAAGNFSVTNPPATNSQLFYRLQLP